MTSRQGKLKLIHTQSAVQSEKLPAKIVHDDRGVAIWAEEVPLELADSLSLVDAHDQQPTWEPYDSAGTPPRPKDHPRR